MSFHEPSMTNLEGIIPADDFARRADIMARKKVYEKFSMDMMRSPFLLELARNNRPYRHILRFLGHSLGFLVLYLAMKEGLKSHLSVGILLLPLYIYVQGFLISGFMIHSHELSHRQIKTPWLNQTLGIISGLMSCINFYSFQRAHRLHHRNIGNIDAPEAGAPVSLRGQDKILDDDKLYRTMSKVYDKSKIIWYLSSWPLFIIYADYNSWLLPFTDRKGLNKQSVANFILILVFNIIFLSLAPIDYILLYALPMLTGGNAILAITYMHHAHEDSIFFREEDHNQFSTIMATTDRDFGPFINFMMMNNGYHIPHHLNPHIAWYDLKKANAYLRSQLPQSLSYNFYPKSHFFKDLWSGFYEKRLDQNYDYYQLHYLNQGGEA